MTSLRGPLRDAAAAAREGALIVFPTDTVYGIGTRPDDPAATAKVFEAKRRPRGLELPVLVPTVAAARAVAVFDDRAEHLAGALWPGPLTLVLPRGADASAWDLGGDPATVGVRAPHHPLALALLADTGPLAVTSANLSGRPPAETCGELQALFGGAVAVYLCQEGLLDGVASTVLDLAHGPATIIREGALSREALLEHLPDESSLLDSRPSS
jgi:L-threonylcarbamoyladenylate synthase